MHQIERDFVLLAATVLVPLVWSLCWLLWKVATLVIVRIRKSRIRKNKSDGVVTEIGQETVKVPSRFFQILQQIKAKKRLLKVIVLVVLLLGACVYDIKTVRKYFGERPYIVSTFPEHLGQYIDGNQQIAIRFDKPFNTEALKYAIVPEEITVKRGYLSAFPTVERLIKTLTGKEYTFPLFIGLTFTPTRSIPYDKKIVIYFTDIENFSNKGGKHEHAYEFNSPTVPDISEISVKDRQTDVVTNKDIQVKVDSIIADSVAFHVDLEPAATYKIIKEGNDKEYFTLHFDEPLRQGTQYVLKLSRNLQVVDLETHELISKEDTEELTEFTFKTVNEPGLKEVTPHGTAVRPTEKVVLTFNEPMVESSVESNFSVEPSIEGSITWIGNIQMTFNPLNELARGTAYKVTVKKGSQTQKGGSNLTDIIHTFETAGAVKVSGFSPTNGSSNTSIGTNIRVDFNQEVDHTSAQSKVSILPATVFNIWWEGNTLVFDPKSSLHYATKFTVTVSPGIKTVYGIDSQEQFTYTFTTQPETVTLAVPRYTQPAGSFVCNIVATRMALAYKGVTVSTDQVIAGIGSGEVHNGNSGGNPNISWIDHYGVHWDPVANYIRRFRTAEVKRGWSTAGIANEIKNGNPVIIFWYNGVSSLNVDMSWYNLYGAKPGLHSVVVYGYRGPENAPTYLLVKDPWFSKELYSAAAFNSKWNHFNRTAVVVK